MLDKDRVCFHLEAVPRLLSFFVALLLVFVGLGSVLANGSGERRGDARVVNESSLANVQGPAVQQGGEVPHSDHGAGSSAAPSESDDDDCDEPGTTPTRLSFNAPFPGSMFDPPIACNIRPSQGHGAGPEKPPRA